MKIIIGENKNNLIKIYDTHLSTIYGLTYLFTYNTITKKCEDLNKISSNKNIIKKNLNIIKNLADIGYNDYLTID